MAEVTQTHAGRQRDGSAAAAGRRGWSPQPAELGDSPAKLGELLPDQALQVGPGCAATALVGDLHQLPDLVKGKVEQARLFDELETAEVFRAEKPVPGGGVTVRGALGRREQAG